MAILLVTAWLAIGCNPTAEMKAIVIRERYVCVEIAKNDSIQINKVIIDGNEILPTQFTESKANNTWVAKVSFYKTPHIMAWIDNNAKKAREAHEKASYDYEVWAYDMIKQGRLLDPRIRAKQQEYEQKLLKAERELNKWDTLFNTGLPTNWIHELGKYVTIEAAIIE